MSGVCRGLLFFTNSLTFLTSIPILFLAILIHTHAGNSKCNSYFNGPVMVIGIILFVVSTMGMIGAGCGVTFMLWLYEWVLFLCIVVILCFTILVGIGMNKSSYKSNEDADNLQLSQFSDWLQRNFVSKDDWTHIRSCFTETRLCEDIGPGEVKGCCKPPPYCGYELKHGTWVVPESGLRSKDEDCNTWSDDPDIMCYDCNTCKAGYLASLKDNWRKLKAFFTGLIVFLLVNFLIGCCAFQGSR